jgi:hypothetical protein
MSGANNQSPAVREALLREHMKTVLTDDQRKKLNMAASLIGDVMAELNHSEESTCKTCGLVRYANFEEWKIYESLKAARKRVLTGIKR